MDFTFTRTSVTIDEAVAIMLGMAKGPILFTTVGEPRTEDELELLDAAPYSLYDDLKGDEDELESAYLDAKHEGLPPVVISERKAKLDNIREVINKAKAFFCAIKDELTRDEQSALREDIALSDSWKTYITMTSLQEWANAKYGLSFMPTPVGSLRNAVPEVTPPADNKSTSRTRLRDQEKLILDEIERQGHDPRQLPANPAGKSGIKAAICSALKSNELFKGSTVFNKAWERLRNEGAIAEKT